MCKQIVLLSGGKTKEEVDLAHKNWILKQGGQSEEEKTSKTRVSQVSQSKETN